jgi:hypothetical protein
LNYRINKEVYNGKEAATKLRYYVIISILLILLLMAPTCETAKSREVRGIPSFSLDGVQMSYLENDNTTLNLYDWHSGEERQFTFSSPIYYPQISPDAKSIFYTQMAESGYYSELWRLDSSTDQRTKLTGEEYGDIYSYAISPDGLRLAFFAFHDRSNSQRLYLMDLAGSTDIKLVGGRMPALNIGAFIQPVFTDDGSRILFALDRKVYVIDVSSYRVEKIIVTGRLVHHLTASSDYVAYTAIEGGYYQIFSTNLDTGEEKQLTFGMTNKLLPRVDENGYLYYIDAGDMLNPEQLAYLVWLTGRNSTSVFKDYRNDWGRLAWGESYALEFLITAYQAFSDDYFLEEFANHARSLLDNMDISLGIQDYTGVSTYGWSATRYSVDKASRRRGLIHDGMIGVPLAKYILLTGDATQLDSELKELARDSLHALRNIVTLHDDEWVEYETDKLEITKEGEGYYITPAGSSARYDGINLPFNQQNRFGTMLILLYEIDGEPTYLDKALKLGIVFRRHLIPDIEGYKWRYWWGKAATGWDETDALSTNTPSYDGHQGFDSKGYATLELEFVTSLSPYGVFDDEYMDRFVNTFLDPDSKMNFQRAKVGALLADYSQAITEEMGNTEMLAEPWQYIPYLGLVLENGGDASWELKRIDLTAAGEEEILYSGDGLVYFINTGTGIAVIRKGQDQPYRIEFLSDVDNRRVEAASPDNELIESYVK